MNVQAIFILMVVQLFGKEIAVTIEERNVTGVDERIPAYIITALDYQYNRLNELDMLIDGIEKQLISIVRQS